jgi:hypothetical protein
MQRSKQHSRNCQVYYRTVSIRLPQEDYDLQFSSRDRPVDSRKRFSALETMCRERAHLAKREFEYWLAEADEWARYRNSTDPSIEAIPTQLDWCVESPSMIKNS